MDAAAAGQLPAATAVDRVELTVADLNAAVAFYAGVLGLQAERQGERTAVLRAGGPPLLVLRGDPAAPPPPAGAAGLYHVAFLVPGRADLGRVLQRLLARPEGRHLGAADHGVSEALYLSDPEGNGVEIACDRPREAWPRRDGVLAMTSEALDVAGLLALARARGPAGLPAGTRLGHVHLKVTDLARSLAFYTRLGLAVTERWPPHAAFLAAGDYHHHLGLNTWESAGGPPCDPAWRGLRRFRLTVPEPVHVAAAAARLGLPAPAAGADLVAVDPDGIAVAIGSA